MKMCINSAAINKVLKTLYRVLGVLFSGTPRSGWASPSLISSRRVYTYSLSRLCCKTWKLFAFELARLITQNYQWRFILIPLILALAYICIRPTHCQTAFVLCRDGRMNAFTEILALSRPCASLQSIWTRFRASLRSRPIVPGHERFNPSFYTGLNYDKPLFSSIECFRHFTFTFPGYHQNLAGVSICQEAI
jgi:hypothetical protein